MATANIFKVSVLPANFSPNGIYLVPGDAGLVELYVANNTGSSVRKLDPTAEIMSGFLAFSDTAPDLQTTDSPMWWNTATGTLYVRFRAQNGSQSWVEAAPATDFPAFGGNGTANTMSHSDHWHDSMEIHSEW